MQARQVMHRRDGKSDRERAADNRLRHDGVNGDGDNGRDDMATDHIPRLRQGAVRRGKEQNGRRAHRSQKQGRCGKAGLDRLGEAKGDENRDKAAKSGNQLLAVGGQIEDIHDLPSSALRIMRWQRSAMKSRNRRILGSWNSRCG